MVKKRIKIFSVIYEVIMILKFVKEVKLEFVPLWNEEIISIFAKASQALNILLKGWNYRYYINIFMMYIMSQK